MTNGVIRFRGVRIDNGEFVYGFFYLTPIEGKEAILEYDENFCPISVDIETESVSQLVGYDAEGEEVYEGDFLVDENGYKYEAELSGLMVGCWSGSRDDGIPLSLGRKVSA